MASLKLWCVLTDMFDPGRIAALFSVTSRLKCLDGGYYDIALVGEIAPIRVRCYYKEIGPRYGGGADPAGESHQAGSIPPDELAFL